MKPVCVPCQRFFRCKKTGYYFIEAMPVAGVELATPGTTHPEQWTPYKLWVGDMWECQGCGATILSGFGARPIGEHYQEGFEDQVARLGALQLQVNDC
jgi:hypothetical protein